MSREEQASPALKSRWTQWSEERSLCAPSSALWRAMLGSLLLSLGWSWVVLAAPTVPLSATATTAPLSDTPPSAVTLHETARAALLGESSFGLMEHPILPDSWPPNGRARVYFYRSRVLPTGVSRTRVYAAFVLVTLSAVHGNVTSVQRLSRDGSHISEARPVDFDHHAFLERLRAAEQALLTHISAPRGGTLSRELLSPYLELLRREPQLESELNEYAPEFFLWLRSGE